MSNIATAIVLAAGMGVRMQSQKPKVLHAAAGRSLLEHVLSQLSGAGISQIKVVIGHGGEQVKQHLWGKSGAEFFVQDEQLGTANAVEAAQISSLRGTVLICNGDHPLITKDDYRQAVQNFNDSQCDLLFVSARVKNPKGFGRVVRSKEGRLVAIREERDATSAEKKIDEINSGLYVVKGEVLQELLPLVGNDNAKKEFYLTDLIPLALKSKKNVVVGQAKSVRVCRGVNNQEELAMAARALYNRKNRELLNSGVVIIDPQNTYIDSDVTIGAETVIGPGCVISAGTTIGIGCNIEGHSHIRAAKIGNRVDLRWGTVVDQAEILDGAVVGPYARLRPESHVGREAHIGNFVELKKTQVGARSKVNHLTYLGDAEVGEDTNIGCGTITCNYAVDRKKYKTVIGKNVFVGSDTQFVAPINVGDGAIIASGSTITEDVPGGSLAIARSKQVNKTYEPKE